MPEYNIPMTLEEYIEQKLEMLSDFHCRVTKEDIEHFKTLTTEIQVDNYAKDLITRRLTPKPITPKRR